MKRMIIATLLFAGCLTEPTQPQPYGSGGGVPTCWVIKPHKTCTDCGSGGGYSCTSCKTVKKCVACKDAASGGCWDNGTIAKCVTLCP